MKEREDDLESQVINVTEDSKQFQSEYERILEEGKGLYNAFQGKTNRLKEVNSKLTELRVELSNKVCFSVLKRECVCVCVRKKVRVRARV